MKIKYNNDIYKSYMIIEKDAEDCGTDGTFEMKMLSANNINGLLKADLRSMDGKTEIFYNISSRTSFAKKCEFEKMDYEALRKFTASLNALIKHINEYLLDKDHIIVFPDCIFYNEAKKQYEYCLWPFSNIKLSAGLKVLFAYILSIIDYSDQRAVKLAYDLQKQTSSEDFVIDDIMKTSEAFIPRDKKTDGLPAADDYFDRVPSPEDILMAKYTEKAKKEKEEKGTEEGLNKNNAHLGFFEKAALYFRENEPGEIFDDINELKIIKKIKAIEAEEKIKERTKGRKEERKETGNEGSKEELRTEKKRKNVLADKRAAGCAKYTGKEAYLREDELPLEIFDLKEKLFTNR